MARAERNKSRPQIVPAACMCTIILVGVAQYLTVQWLILIHNQAQISYSLGPTLLEVQSAHERGSVAILIEPALVLFPPSNCTLNLKLIVLVGSKYGT